MKIRTIICTTLLAAALISGNSAVAITITVDMAGGGDFTQLQPAVLAAAPGDTIAVRPGQYLGNVKVKGFGGISIIGPSPDDMAVVLGDTFEILVWEVEHPVHFENLEIRGTRLRGALHFAFAQATVLNCALRENHSTNGCSDVGGGSALYYGSDVRFENCLFENNTGWDAAGGLIVWDSRADVIGCTFRGNQACYGGAMEFYHCGDSGYSSGFEPSVVEYNLFQGNTATELGGALMTIDSAPIIRFNTFVDNDSPIGSAIRLMQGEPVIENNVITGSDIPITCLGYETIPAAEPIMGRNLVWGHGGEPVGVCANGGDIVSADPGFCDPEEGDFRVCTESPCLEGSQLGAFGAGCQECMVSIEQNSMGSFKALYR